MSDQSKQPAKIQDLNYSPTNILIRFIRMMYPIYTQPYLPPIIENDLRDCINALLGQYLYACVKEYWKAYPYTGKTPDMIIEEKTSEVYQIIKSACIGRERVALSKFTLEANAIFEKASNQLTENEHHPKPSNQA